MTGPVFTGVKKLEKGELCNRIKIYVYTHIKKGGRGQVCSGVKNVGSSGFH